jgi:hypothetical protein
MKRLIWITLLLLGCPKSTTRPKDIGNACSRNADCASGVCLPVSSSLTVCTATCNANLPGDCPAGWTCEPLSVGGTPLCDCVPTTETCDGVDNNCNGLIDEGCGVTVTDLAGADLSLPPVPATDKVDVLFVVDNSPSMLPIQDQLKVAFPTLAAALNDFPAKGAATSFHIGVVTTDLGAGTANIGGGQCRPGGLGAKLVTKGAVADVSCQPPTGGKNYMEIDQIGGGNNLPVGQSVEQTFTCMASVGAMGCGFEHQLESAYRALHDPIPENNGFLRADALLAIIWVTNEDDCSAPPDSDLFEQANTQYGSLTSYRCTHYGIMCGNPPMLMPYADSLGPLTSCQGATAAVGGKLFDVSRYINYFTQPGGVKSNPAAVILASLQAPTTPVESIQGNIQTYQPCAGPVGQAMCEILLQHSCVNPVNTAINGDPAVRMAQVLNAVSRNLQSSVCESDYTPAMQSIADRILAARMGQ